MVTTKYGRLEGLDEGSYVKYLGVPYAKPPVGALRWKAPEPTDPWEGVYAATHFGARCPQREGSSPPWDKDFYDDPSYAQPMSEDCLYLNIWAPKDAKNAPVAFWIHGGAFMGGSGGEKEFDGAAYCERGVIFVSINYRLGIFGFYAHPWLTAEAGRSGNYGALDQAAALNWVYENIAAFGGDPENITVFGQSAGAMSTQTLISSPLTKGKIARAILQSGGTYGAGLNRDITMAEQEEFGKALPEVMGAKSLEEMRAASTEALYAASDKFMGKVMPQAKGLFLVPVIDGYLLTHGYKETFDRNEIHQIPYMLGSTKDDIGKAPEGADPADSMLNRGSIAFSHKLEELGRKPAYVYFFTRNLPGDDQGAWHSSELWYMMGTQDRCWRPWTDGDRALSAEMMDYWTNFMRTGDPNGGALAPWTPCDRAESFVMDLNVK